MPALNVNTLVPNREYLIYTSLYPNKKPRKYLGRSANGELQFNAGFGSRTGFNPRTTQFYNVNATDYPAITYSAPASSSSTAATTSAAPASSSSTAATTSFAPTPSSSTAVVRNGILWMTDREAERYEEAERLAGIENDRMTGRGGKRYTTHKQRKHKSRKSRKGRKSQKRRRS
jgi:hypothetical protein